MGTVAWGVSFGEWGDSWGSSSTAASVGGGSYKSKRRVLIGKETLYVTDQELSVILQQMLDEDIAPPTPLVEAQPGAQEATPVQAATIPRYEHIARQQGEDFDALMQEIARQQDEEDIEMLVLH